MLTATTLKTWGLAAALAFCASTPVHAKTVYLDMDVELDQVAPEDAKMYLVGGHDLDRIAYDDASVDPVTHKAKVTYLAHFILGRWIPTTPTDASTLDLSSTPYKLNLVSAVNHGRPLLVVFEGDTWRMAILARPDFHMLIAGKYGINSKPLNAEEAAKPPEKANDPSTMPLKSGMPPMPPAVVVGAGHGLSTESTYGQLLENPQSHAVLVKLIPEIVNNPQSQMGKGLPLKALSQFEPTLTSEKLKEIDASLAKLPKRP